MTGQSCPPLHMHCAHAHTQHTQKNLESCIILLNCDSKKVQLTEVGSKMIVTRSYGVRVGKEGHGEAVFKVCESVRQG